MPHLLMLGFVDVGVQTKWMIDGGWMVLASSAVTEPVTGVALNGTDGGRRLLIKWLLVPWLMTKSCEVVDGGHWA